MALKLARLNSTDRTSSLIFRILKIIESAGVHQSIVKERIVSQLRANKQQLASQFASNSPHGIRNCHIDNLIGEVLISSMNLEAPRIGGMVRRASLNERKYVDARVGNLAPDLQSLVLSFSDPEVAKEVSDIAGDGELVPDEILYNGGLTVMTRGDFQRPHLDNSHDYLRIHRRRIVGLYYCARDWRIEDGGALQLWHDLRRSPPEEIVYAPDRFVLLEVGDAAWHGVARVEGGRARVSVTTYYYDAEARPETPRLTRFAAPGGQPLQHLMCSADFYVRTCAQRLGLDGIRRNRHRANS